MEPVEIIKVGNTLGECALWNADTQSLWWTDIQERRLYRYDWETQSLTVTATQERLCSFGFVQGSKSLIAAFESGFALYNPFDGAMAWLARLEGHHLGMRFNDGRVDRQGRFWAGSMAETAGRAGKASLYCVDGAGRPSRRENGITISNGICWSPDGTQFYFADSPRRTIWRYEFDGASGGIFNRRVFAETPKRIFPDGACVDAEGFVWSAQWGAGRIVRYAPDGQIDRILQVPVSQPSCVAFGGPKLDLLFVTTARDGLKEDALRKETNAGDVLVYDVGVAGLPEMRCLLDTTRIRRQFETHERMTMSQTDGQNLTYRIVQDLGIAIVSGKYSIKNPFPIEADLCTQYGASRSVLREAVKMLTAKGLLSARPRQGTWVQPEGNWNLLDPDVLRWLLERKFSFSLLREFTQVRLAVEPKAAALAAVVAGPAEKTAIKNAIKRMVAADEGDDDPLAADIAFHVAILSATGNRFYLQLRSVTETALRFSIRMTNRVKGVHRASTSDHKKISDAILAGNAIAAETAMLELIQEALDLIKRADNGPAAETKPAAAKARNLRVRKAASQERSSAS